MKLYLWQNETDIIYAYLTSDTTPFEMTGKVIGRKTKMKSIAGETATLIFEPTSVVVIHKMKLYKVRLNQDVRKGKFENCQLQGELLN